MNRHFTPQPRFIGTFNSPLQQDRPSARLMDPAGTGEAILR